MNGGMIMNHRADYEKKTITKSLKISPGALEQIERSASEKGMRFSQYMIDCALHGENALTPEILCKIENIIELCNKACISDNMDDRKKLREEADLLWDSLK